MAKQTNKEKKMNPLLWILFAVIIPLIIIIIIIVVFLYFSNFSLSEWARESDNFVANLIEKAEETEPAEGEDTIDTEEQNEKLTEKDDEIEYLMGVIDELEFTVTDLEQEVLRLENNLETDEADQTAVDEAPQGASEVKRLAQSYEEMDSDRAAQILAAMDDSEAVLILRDIATDVRGEILQEMENEHAARLSLLLMNE